MTIRPEQMSAAYLAAILREREELREQVEVLEARNRADLNIALEWAAQAIERIHVVGLGQWSVREHAAALARKGKSE